MFGALVIVFREVIEAGLIIGIVLAATRGVGGRGQWVAGGVVAGALGAGIVALFAEAIADAFEGSGQELFNASVLGAAVLMLMWHAAWMARHGREMAAEMADDGALRRRWTCRAARRCRSRAVSLRYPRWRYVGLFAFRRRHARTGGRGGIYGTDLLWTDQHSRTAYFHRDGRAHRIAGSGHGGAGGAVPGRRRRDQRAGRPIVGQFTVAAPGRHHRPLAARAGRLHRPPNRAAAHCLSRDARSHGRAHMAGNARSLGAAPRRVAHPAGRSGQIRAAVLD